MKLTRSVFKRFAVGLLMATAASFALAADKVLYHIDDAGLQATRALRNVRNQLDVAPKTNITMVAHADGVDFLLEGARDDKNNIEYASLISDLKARGVNFEVCEITMERRKLEKSQFVLEATFTKSGVVRITELQNQKHYAYIKP